MFSDVFPRMHQKCKFVDSIWKLNAMEKYVFSYYEWLGDWAQEPVNRLDIYLLSILATYSKLKSRTKQSGWVSPAGVTDEAGGE